jgi:nitrilase
MSKICSATKSSKIAVVLGFSENDNNSLYISQCTISAGGDIVMRRRKLKPTHMERTVFGDASGSSLINVAEIKDVGKVGALSCWEHIQPLLKYHTMSQREQIHVAAWPMLHPFQEGSEGLYSMTTEGKHDVPHHILIHLHAQGCAALSQAYAMESSAFVLHCTTVMTAPGISLHKTEGNPVSGVVGGGHSAVYGPDGRCLTKSIPADQEGFVYAELPMEMLISMRHFADPIGHYSRPDMLWLGVDAREKKHIRMAGSEPIEKEGNIDQ